VYASGTNCQFVPHEKGLPMNTALLLIDIQKDYFPGGKMELVEPLLAAQKAYALLQCFREHGGHHVHIQHISKNPKAAFFISGDRGTDIHDSVAHFEGEPIVYKHYPNSFRETNLLETLQGWEIKRLVICGMMTHMCVDATVRAAADLGFEVILVSDACATRDLEFEGVHVPAAQVQTAFLAALRSYASVLTLEQAISRLASEQTF
jgi:nicotinamidase-related amidase